MNCSIAEQLERFKPVFERARADGIAIRAYVSTVCGCPYEGRVAVSSVVALTREIIACGASEVSLGDTIGVGFPNQVRELVIDGIVPPASLRDESVRGWRPAAVDGIARLEKGEASRRCNARLGRSG